MRLRLLLGSFLAISLIGIISCGNPAQEACSDEKVIKTLKAGLFGKDLITAMFFGDKFIEKKYWFSEEELKSIYSGLKKTHSEEEAIDFVNYKLRDKIEFLDLTFFKGSPDKKIYYCEGLFQIPNGEKYSVKYTVEKIADEKYKVDIKKVTVLNNGSAQ